MIGDSDDGVELYLQLTTTILNNKINAVNARVLVVTTSWQGGRGVAVILIDDRGLC